MERRTFGGWTFIPARAWINLSPKTSTAESAPLARTTTPFLRPGLTKTEDQNPPARPLCQSVVPSPAIIQPSAILHGTPGIVRRRCETNRIEALSGEDAGSTSAATSLSRSLTVERTAPHPASAAKSQFDTLRP